MLTIVTTQGDNSSHKSINIVCIHQQVCLFLFLLYCTFSSLNSDTRFDHHQSKSAPFLTDGVMCIVTPDQHANPFPFRLLHHIVSNITMVID